MSFELRIIKYVILHVREQCRAKEDWMWANKKQAFFRAFFILVESITFWIYRSLTRLSTTDFKQTTQLKIVVPAPKTALTKCILTLKYKITKIVINV